MKKILFVTNSFENCGVFQHGKSTAKILSSSKKFEFCYLECGANSGGAITFLNALHEHAPDGVIYNWHPGILPWLNNDLYAHIQRCMPKSKHLVVVHDGSLSFSWADALIHLDPDFEEKGAQYRVGRVIPSYHPKQQAPSDDCIIGSFGFGFKHKNFARLVEQVNREFDHATIRLHIPWSSYGDPQGHQARQHVEECRGIAKAGITIHSSHDFLDQNALLDWLAGNTINCFFFDKCEGWGISSSIENALAVKRPIAITDSYMFRHVRNAVPSIIIDGSSLKQIISNGIKPLEPFYKRWTAENLLKDYERILDKVFQTSKTVNKKRQSDAIDAVQASSYNLSSNRVLTTEDRVQLQPVIEELKHLCPDMMQRKFPQAVFQNAFIFQQAKSLAKKTDRIIVIGGYEDPIGPALQKLGFQVTITDPNPQIDGMDMEAVWKDSILRGTEYDLVICCSVLEHVDDDASFIKQMYQILKPGGTALLTTDYRADWKEGVPKPSVDCRLYTAKSLNRLVQQLPANTLLNAPTWGADIEPYLSFESATYSFCSFAFRKPATDISFNKDVVRPYIIEEIDRKIDSLQNCNKNLQNQLDQLHQLGQYNLAIARKLHVFSMRFPAISKFSKKIVFGLLFMKKRLFATKVRDHESL